MLPLVLLSMPSLEVVDKLRKLLLVVP